MAEIEIYLDMDGVCVDFIGAAMTAQGYDAAATLAEWEREHAGTLFPEALMGKPPEDFFTHENLHPHEFWSGLVPYPWFDHLYEELTRIGHVIFLTAPTNAPGCVSGKHEWLINTFGHGFGDFIFTRHKARLAHPDAYLVDDLPHNITPFDERGGHGILFPQLWNEWHQVEDKVSHVVERLDNRIKNR